MSVYYGPDTDQNSGDIAVNKTVFLISWNLHSTKRGLENKHVRYICALGGDKICENKTGNMDTM